MSIMASPNLDNVFKLLTENENFLTHVKISIEHVIKDGKISSHDIPEIVLLATSLYNELQNMKVTREELPILLKMIITFVINKLDLLPENTERQVELEKAVDISIQLILMQPKMKKGILSSLCDCFKN